MKILILGASGQIGSALFDYLSKNKADEVLGTARSASNNNLIQFDPFSDDWKSLGRYDVLINCVGVIRANSTFTFNKVHYGITQMIIQNRSFLGNPKIIQISVLGADEKDDIEFLNTKGKADNLLLKEKDTYIIRPSIVCTHRTMLVKKIRMLGKTTRIFGGMIAVPKGFPDHRIQPVLIDDLICVVGNICRIKAEDRIINVVGPEEITYRSLIQMASGHSVKIVELQERLVRFAVKNFISVIMPGMIQYDQYKLLFKDNVDSVKQTEKYLIKSPTSTDKFWKEEFK